MQTPAELAALLPDESRWVEARACLLGGACEVTGVELGPALACVVRDRDSGTVFVLGSPDRAAVRAAIDPGRDTSVIAGPEHGEWLMALVPGWARSSIVVHELDSPAGLPDSEHVAILGSEALAAAGLPEALADELLGARAAGATIVGTMVEGRAVAFAYAGAVTERWWDISIDTLAAHRRRGHAAACVSALIRRFWAEGKRPVWQSVEHNPGSWRLARKLGFVAVGALVMFERDG